MFLLDTNPQPSTPNPKLFNPMQSVLLEVNGVRVACCELVPPTPELPSDWAAGIEANFAEPSGNKSYTINRYEMYSTTLDKVKVEEYVS